MSNFYASPKVKILASSGVAVSHTGNTNETTLATITVPAGAMGLHGELRVSSLWSMTNSANNKTIRAKLGGSNFFATTQTTIATYIDIDRIIQNRGVANSQVCRPTGTISGGTSAAVTTLSVDTATAQDIVLTAQLATAGETITLESYLIELITP